MWDTITLSLIFACLCPVRRSGGTTGGRYTGGDIKRGWGPCFISSAHLRARPMMGCIARADGRSSSSRMSHDGVHRTCRWAGGIELTRRSRVMKRLCAAPCGWWRGSINNEWCSNVDCACAAPPRVVAVWCSASRGRHRRWSYTQLVEQKRRRGGRGRGALGVGRLCAGRTRQTRTRVT